MLKVNINNLELNEFIAKNNPVQHCKATFPLFGAHGTAESSTVYFELEPGDELGTHTDSAEELLLIVEGSVEISVGERSGAAIQGDLIHVPKLFPHNIRNTGAGKARVLGFFGGANHIVATFDNVWLPTESNTVDTSLLV
ncbi:MAG: cupin domain-containing protein [Ignavibacteriaceae bacterium]